MVPFDNPIGPKSAAFPAPAFSIHSTPEQPAGEWQCDRTDLRHGPELVEQHLEADVMVFDVGVAAHVPDFARAFSRSRKSDGA